MAARSISRNKEAGVAEVFPLGCLVRIGGFDKTAPEMDGRTGMVIAQDDDDSGRGRRRYYQVELDDDDDDDEKK